MEPTDWKVYLQKYKWMPYRRVRDRFGLKKHDIDNFLRNPDVRKVFDPWRISAKRSPEELRAILKNAWEYYLTRVVPIDVSGSPRSWVPQLLAIKNVGKSEFSFLVGSKYLEIACPDGLEEFKNHGYTNVALAAYEFFPGSDVLRRNAVYPYMFQQTHANALDTTDAQSMIDHVYLNFLSEGDEPNQAARIHSAKESLYMRYRESGFVTGAKLSKFGVPANFYSKENSLGSILEALHKKYGVELGYLPEADSSWSSAVFKKKFPERNTDACEYCALSPVDLHHLLPRKSRPDLIYDSENVVPLCVNVHQRITRGKWTDDEVQAYNKAQREWLIASKDANRRQSFKPAMKLIHSIAYTKSFLPDTGEP